MITTGCETCCFLKKNNGRKGCVLRQVCAIKDDIAFTTGYCRMCRSSKWAKNQDTTELQQLYNKVLEERFLELDMLVFFNEQTNRIEDLRKTLDSDWYKKYAKTITIVDTTGFGERKNIALEYIKSVKDRSNLYVNSSVDNESIQQRGDTIRRCSKTLISPFFLAIPAGTMLRNFDLFAKMIQHIPSRVIHWSFPFTIGTTAIVPNKLHSGLFITKAYRSLMKSPDTESFTKQLRIEELETEMGLSWFCTDCWLV